MSYRWDDELTEKFLTLYRKHKCLWNPYSPDYRNSYIKNKAFEIVVQKLNVPGIRISECLQQIEVVREKYKQQQLRAEEELKSGKLFTSKVPWFNLMSQMLCEVINDEEKFSEEPVKILPCTTVIKDQQSKDPKPEKYVESKSKQINSKAHIISQKGQLNQVKSGLKKPHDGQSENNDRQSDLETLTDTNDPWNRCPSCGWEEEKNQNKAHKGAKQFNNCKERGVQIDREIEVPLRIEKTNTLDTINDVGEVNQPPPLCVNGLDDLNWKIRSQESDVMRINPGIERLQGSRETCHSTQPTKFSVTEDKVPPPDDTRAINTRQVMSFKENNVHCPRMGPNRIADIDRSQYLENQLRNLQINQTDHRIDEPRPNLILYKSTLAPQSQKVSKFEGETDGTKDANGCNLCVQQYGERSKKYSTTSEDDKYEVCSLFKIVIPSSDWEDQNLEITRYEVCATNPLLSKYILCPTSEIPKPAIGDAECTCRNEFPAAKRIVNLDSTRYSSVIKLDVNRKRSKETQTRKQSRTSGTTYTRGVTDAKNNWVSEIRTQHKSFSNKKTQTDSSYENESLQTLRDTETRKFNSSKSVKDQGCAMDLSSSNEKACRVTTLDENEKLISQHQSISKDQPAVSKDLSGSTADPQINNTSLPVEKLNITETFLSVIAKLLDSDVKHEKSEDLHKTLDTMLASFQHGSIIVQNTTKDHVDHDTNGTRNKDTSISTKHKSLALNPAPVNRQVEDINARKSTDKTVGLDNAPAEFRSLKVEPDDTRSYLGPSSLSLGEPKNPVTKEADENKRNFGTVDDKNEPMTERGTGNGPPASLLDDTNMSNFAADSDLNYTDEFFNNEPIASSSRKIEEHETSSQLAKDFLDVIKYTMMMDGIQQIKGENSR